MNTPTADLLDLLDAAQHGPALSSIRQLATGDDLIAAAEQGLIVVDGGVIPMAEAVDRSLLRQNAMTVTLTDAGRAVLEAL